MRWIEFEYRVFHDVPRIIVVRLSGGLLLLDSAFDADRDDYSPEYRCYLLPITADLSGSWEDLAAAGELIGSVPVKAVAFDVERRSRIDLDTVSHLLRLPGE